MIEIFGYAASVAVFATFWMKTMIPLRVVAIGSNVLFLFYGLLGDLIPIAILHGCLLPLNMFRLYESVRLKNRIHHMANTDFNVKSLLPFMTEHRFVKDSYLFASGDEAHDIFYLAEGRVNVVELDIDIDPGNLVGEMAMFSPDHRRTQSIKCKENCVFLGISKDKVMQMFSDNPEFGLYLIKMIVARLLINANRSDSPIAKQESKD